MISDKKKRLYMDLALRVSEETYAKRKKAGCVIVTIDDLLLIGYNGTPSGCSNNCEGENGKTLQTVLHAETNAISKASGSTANTRGSSLFVTLSPCQNCANSIIQSGIKYVYYLNKYKDTTPIEYLESVGIRVYCLKRLYEK